jgi:hypothetical protein
MRLPRNPSLIAAVVVAAACAPASDRNARPVAHRTPTPGNAGVVTTSSPLPPVDFRPPPVRPPLDVASLDLSSDDVEAVARNIALVVDEAHHRPDPALADLVMHPGCTCHARVAGYARQLLAAGEREIDANYRVVRTQLISMLETGEAVVRVVHEQGPVAIMRADGTVRNEDGWPLQRTIYYMRREGGRWLVVDIELEGMGDVE